MENEREYPLPGDVVEYHVKLLALKELRDRYTRLRLSYKKAKKAAIEAEESKHIFWKRVKEIYPELKGKDMTYSTICGLVINN